MREDRHCVDWTKRQSIVVRGLGMRPLFVMDFYGLDTELSTVGEGLGGFLVADALRRRDIDPESVILTLWDVFDGPRPTALSRSMDP